ncbi:hypothetical protein PYW07_013249 [Mythimna separata]|uniref:START domain-containing protein n=1 Tax=Mythimna separata TaxID=271217 RepID=A0AAD7Y6E1_MYTSE|nr:hypothetical protein PYW07_013249 [Mythimna separata]
MSAFRFILRDFRVWSAWTRSNLVSTVVKRCKRDRSVREVIQCFRQTFRPRRTLLISATAAYKARADDEEDETPVSCDTNITDEQLQALLSELDGVETLSRNTLFCHNCGKRLVIEKKQPGVPYCACKVSETTEDTCDGWVPYMEAEDVIIWRKEYKPGLGLYAYKVYGRYPDVRASDFAAVQVDGAYRTVWDAAVAALAVVERHANGLADQAVLHWEVLWPVSRSCSLVDDACLTVWDAGVERHAWSGRPGRAALGGAVADQAVLHWEVLWPVSRSCSLVDDACLTVWDAGVERHAWSGRPGRAALGGAVADQAVLHWEVLWPVSRSCSLVDDACLTVWDAGVERHAWSGRPGRAALGGAVADQAVLHWEVLWPVSRSCSLVDDACLTVWDAGVERHAWSGRPGRAALGGAVADQAVLHWEVLWPVSRSCSLVDDACLTVWDAGVERHAWSGRPGRAALGGAVADQAVLHWEVLWPVSRSCSLVDDACLTVWDAGVERHAWSGRPGRAALGGAVADQAVLHWEVLWPVSRSCSLVDDACLTVWDAGVERHAWSGRPGRAALGGAVADQAVLHWEVLWPVSRSCSLVDDACLTVWDAGVERHAWSGRPGRAALGGAVADQAVLHWEVLWPVSRSCSLVDDACLTVWDAGVERHAWSGRPGRAALGGAVADQAVLHWEVLWPVSRSCSLVDDACLTVWDAGVERHAWSGRPGRAALGGAVADQAVLHWEVLWPVSRSCSLVDDACLTVWDAGVERHAWSGRPGRAALGGAVADQAVLHWEVLWPVSRSCSLVDDACLTVWDAGVERHAWSGRPGRAALGGAVADQAVLHWEVLWPVSRSCSLVDDACLTVWDAGVERHAWSGRPGRAALGGAVADQAVLHWEVLWPVSRSCSLVDDACLTVWDAGVERHAWSGRPGRAALGGAVADQAVLHWEVLWPVSRSCSLVDDACLTVWDAGVERHAWSGRPGRAALGGAVADQAVLHWEVLWPVSRSCSLVDDACLTVWDAGVERHAWSGRPGRAALGGAVADQAVLHWEVLWPVSRSCSLVDDACLTVWDAGVERHAWSGRPGRAALGGAVADQAVLHWEVLWPVSRSCSLVDDACLTVWDAGVERHAWSGRPGRAALGGAVADQAVLHWEVLWPVSRSCSLVDDACLTVWDAGVERHAWSGRPGRAALGGAVADQAVLHWEVLWPVSRSCSLVDDACLTVWDAGVERHAWSGRPGRAALGGAVADQAVLHWEVLWPVSRSCSLVDDACLTVWDAGVERHAWSGRPGRAALGGAVADQAVLHWEVLWPVSRSCSLVDDACLTVWDAGVERHAWSGRPGRAALGGAVADQAVLHWEVLWPVSRSCSLVDDACLTVWDAGVERHAWSGRPGRAALGGAVADQAVLHWEVLWPVSRSCSLVDDACLTVWDAGVERHAWSGRPGRAALGGAVADQAVLHWEVLWPVSRSCSLVDDACLTVWDAGVERHAWSGRPGRAALGGAVADQAVLHWEVLWPVSRSCSLVDDACLTVWDAGVERHAWSGRPGRAALGGAVADQAVLHWEVLWPVSRSCSLVDDACLTVWDAGVERHAWSGRPGRAALGGAVADQAVLHWEVLWPVSRSCSLVDDACLTVWDAGVERHAWSGRPGRAALGGAVADQAVLHWEVLWPVSRSCSLVDDACLTVWDAGVERHAWSGRPGRAALGGAVADQAVLHWEVLWPVSRSCSLVDDACLTVWDAGVERHAWSGRPGRAALGGAVADQAVLHWEVLWPVSRSCSLVDDACLTVWDAGVERHAWSGRPGRAALGGAVADQAVLHWEVLWPVSRSCSLVDDACLTVWDAGVERHAWSGRPGRAALGGAVADQAVLHWEVLWPVSRSCSLVDDACLTVWDAGVERHAWSGRPGRAALGGAVADQAVLHWEVLWPVSRSCSLVDDACLTVWDAGVERHAWSGRPGRAALGGAVADQAVLHWEVLWPVSRSCSLVDDACLTVWDAGVERHAWSGRPGRAALGGAVADQAVLHWEVLWPVSRSCSLVDDACLTVWDAGVERHAWSGRPGRAALGGAVADQAVLHWEVLWPVSRSCSLVDDACLTVWDAGVERHAWSGRPGRAALGGAVADQAVLHWEVLWPVSRSCSLVDDACLTVWDAGVERHAWSGRPGRAALGGAVADQAVLHWEVLWPVSRSCSLVDDACLTVWDAGVERHAWSGRPGRAALGGAVADQAVLHWEVLWPVSRSCSLVDDACLTVWDAGVERHAWSGRPGRVALGGAVADQAVLHWEVLWPVSRSCSLVDDACLTVWDAGVERHAWSGRPGRAALGGAVADQAVLHWEVLWPVSRSCSLVDDACLTVWDAGVERHAWSGRPGRAALGGAVADQAVLHWEVLWPVSRSCSLVDDACLTVWDAGVERHAWSGRPGRAALGGAVAGESLVVRLFANRDYVYIRRHKEFDIATKSLPHKEGLFRPPPCDVRQETIYTERPSVHSKAKRKAMETYESDREGEPSDNKVYVIISRSCEHPKVPETKHAIRVSEYWSHMVVKTLDGPDKMGMEFVLTYYDEPAVGGMPSTVAAWATGRAAPAYLQRMRKAACEYRAWRLARHQQDLPEFIPFVNDAEEPCAEVVNTVNEEDMESSQTGPELDATREQGTQTEAITSLPPQSEVKVTQLPPKVTDDKPVANQVKGKKVDQETHAVSTETESSKEEEEPKSG